MVKRIMSGWWFQPIPLKNDGVKVSWDDDIPKIWTHNPKHQNQIYYILDISEYGIPSGKLT